jgi:hypothetical protein
MTRISASSAIRACRLLVAGCALCFPLHVRGQDQREKRQRPPKVEPAAPIAEAKSNLVVHVYPVEDLLLIQDDYPYRGGLPASETFGGVTGGSGGGLGGGSGTGGGRGSGFLGGVTPGAGGAAMSETQRRSRRAAGLINVIKTCVEGDWESEHSECLFFDNNLIVRHTEEGQLAVSKLLRALESRSSSGHSVTLEATWLILTPQQLASLRGPAAEGGTSKVDPKTFRDLSQQATVLHGQITCSNGQQVHLATGRRQVIAVGGIPTVGVGAAAYQPTTSVINVGAVLQVTPSVSADSQKAFVDLHSVMTQWHEPAKPPIVVSADVLAGTSEKKVEGPAVHTLVTIDRANIETQEWSTTVAIPIAQPAYVGSVSLSSDKAGRLEPGQNPELTLVIEVRAN